MQQRIVIDIKGDDEGDMELALDEAMRLIKSGCLAGAGKNDSGSFSFSVENPED